MTGINNANNIHNGLCRQAGKLRYPTRKDAKRSARSRNMDSAVAPYLCDSCQDWHLGKLPVLVVRGEIGREAIYRLTDDPDSWKRRTVELVERYRRDRTVMQLSNATGRKISARQWRSWKLGHDRIPAELVELVAEVLGAPVDEVLAVSGGRGAER